MISHVLHMTVPTLKLSTVLQLRSANSYICSIVNDVIPIYGNDVMHSMM